MTGLKYQTQPPTVHEQALASARRILRLASQHEHRACTCPRRTVYQDLKLRHVARWCLYQQAVNFLKKYGAK